jgi:hypothetical protein
MKDRFGTDWTGAQGSGFWRAPHWSRRVFFRHVASAVGGYFLLPPRPMEAARSSGTTINKAKNVVFVMMNGGPSHVDTFDFKLTGATPAAFEPETYGDIVWPRGIMPKLAERLDDALLLRSMRAWAAVHQLAQSWVQIGRSPTSAMAKIAPHIGSVVSLELTNKNAVLPAFLSLNAGSGPGPGYLSSEHAPFYISPRGNGLGNTRHPDGEETFARRYQLVRDLAAEEDLELEFGPIAPEIASYNFAARRMMYDPNVDKVFTFGADERMAYGNTNFGSACLAARNLIRADLGARFIQITIGGWDNHAGIYTGAFNPSNANSLIRQFDAGLGALLADLKSEGLLSQTLVIAMGEFGRTVRGPQGSLNGQGGRDHYLQQAAFLAGAGVRGGTVLGRTDATGAETIETGWSADRLIRVEDLEATIYSALGIDWTTVRYDDPFGRGFEYVPDDPRYDYRPITELWG